MSGVAMSRWSIDLKPRVRGNGSLTDASERDGVEVSGRQHWTETPRAAE